MVLSYCADESRWLPIELTSPDDVEQLNELLSDGWRIERLDIEGLPFLAFCGRKGKSLLAERGASSTCVDVITHAARGVHRTYRRWLHRAGQVDGGANSSRVHRDLPDRSRWCGIDRGGVGVVLACCSCWRMSPRHLTILTRRVKLSPPTMSDTM